jgi:hypothetical protein
MFMHQRLTLPPVAAANRSGGWPKWQANRETCSM